MLKNILESYLEYIPKLHFFLPFIIFFNESCMAVENKIEASKITEYLLHQFHNNPSTEQFFPVELLEEKFTLNCNDKEHSAFRTCTSSISAESSIYSSLTILQTMNSNKARDGLHERIMINIPTSACLTYFDFTTMLPAGFTTERDTYQSPLTIRSVQSTSIRNIDTKSSTVFDYIDYKPGRSYSIYIDINPFNENKCISTAIIQSYRKMQHE
jgi:hypothetical protein